MVPTWLVVSWRCTRCGASWKIKYQQSDSNKTSREMSRTLRICQNCASADLRKWGER